MFRIGEFSKITQVSIRMLRYYDENGLLIPEKVDEATGYRLYSGNQIEQLKRIIFLKDLGFHVKKIKQLLTEWETDRIKEELEHQKRELECIIQNENERLLRIHASLKDIERQKLHLSTQIVIKNLPSLPVISIRRILPDYFSECLLWKELSERLPEANGMACFSIYHDFDYRERDVDIEACIIDDGRPLSGRKELFGCRRTEMVERAACFMVYGPYENISTAYREFGLWLENHPEYRMCGGNRQICHVSSCDTDNPDEYITELQVPIEIIHSECRNEE